MYYDDWYEQDTGHSCPYNPMCACFMNERECEECEEQIKYMEWLENEERKKD